MVNQSPLFVKEHAMPGGLQTTNNPYVEDPVMFQVPAPPRLSQRVEDRPVTWIWQRAWEVSKDRAPLPGRFADGVAGYFYIDLTMQYLNDISQAKGDADDIACVNDKYFDIHQALYIHTRADRHTRWTLEARMLARQSDEQISKYCPLSAEGICIYRNLFFDIEDRIDQRDFIINQVFGPSYHRGITERNYDLLWKTYGYFLGPAVLDVMMAKMVDPTWSDDPSKVIDILREDVIKDLVRTGAIAAKTIMVDTRNQQEIMTNLIAYIAATNDSGAATTNQYNTHITAMMDNLPFTTAGHDPETGKLIERSPDDPMAKFDEKSIELPFKQLMHVKAGGTLADEEERLNMKFPEPPNRDDDGGIVHPALRK